MGKQGKNPKLGKKPNWKATPGTIIAKVESERRSRNKKRRKQLKDYKQFLKDVNLNNCTEILDLVDEEQLSLPAKHRKKLKVKYGFST